MKRSKSLPNLKSSFIDRSEQLLRVMLRKDMDGSLPNEIRDKILRIHFTNYFPNLEKEIHISNILNTYYDGHEEVYYDFSNMKYLPIIHNIPSQWQLQAKNSRNYISDISSHVLTIRYNNASYGYNKICKKNNRYILSLINTYAIAFENNMVDGDTVVQDGLFYILFVKSNNFTKWFHEYNTLLYKQLDNYLKYCLLYVETEKYKRDIKFIQDYYNNSIEDA